MTTTRPGPASTAADGPSAPAAFVRVRRLFETGNSTYYLLLGTTLFLVAFGLVMVLSSSAIENYAATGDFFGAAARQGLFALLGVPLMLLASRMPVSFWKRWAWHAVLIGVGLQVLVVFTPLGVDHQGNRNWLNLGFATLQPSEVVKLGLVIWLALILTRKQDVLHDWRQLVLPILPVAGGSIGLVLVGNDLGTGIIMLLLVIGALFFGGMRLKHLGVTVGAIAVLGVLATMASDSRMRRINAWLEGYGGDFYNDLGWQPQHGLYALASGGFFGVGLGNSKAKWSWLPEADNDFIFAIIGEELGMIGAIVVLLLFVVLTIAFMRVIRHTTDIFARVACASVMVWVVGQAFVNIAVVLGLLPVLGVPLPLISAGGSALVTTMVAIGVVLSFARTQGSTR